MFREVAFIILGMAITALSLFLSEFIRGIPKAIRCPSVRRALMVGVKNSLLGIIISIIIIIGIGYWLHLDSANLESLAEERHEELIEKLDRLIDILEVQNAGNTTTEQP